MNFSKLQATGNDFIFIDARNHDGEWAAMAKTMCDRHFGIGADGLILVKNSSKADFQMRIFNPDGSEAQICGNGLRCFAKYVIDNNLTAKTLILVSTLAGIKQLNANLEGGKVVNVNVNMGKPLFTAAAIPVNLGMNSETGKINPNNPILDFPIEVSGLKLTIAFVSMGNPHAVCFIKEPVASFRLSEIGPKMENFPIFPERTNFEIANVVNQSTINVRVWERGAGETLACGSGACAVAVAAQLKGIAKREVDIMLTGGTLSVSWDGVGDVYMKGSVKHVFNGTWHTN